MNSTLQINVPTHYILNKRGVIKRSRLIIMILEVALENANLKNLNIHCDNIVSTIEVFNKA
jgi:hypothetical protein